MLQSGVLFCLPIYRARIPLGFPGRTRHERRTEDEPIPDTGVPSLSAVTVRAARLQDAEAAAALLRASIRELCTADHGRDPAAIARWLANKTADQFRAWVEAPGWVVAAERSGQLVGIGQAIPSGQITLNYVLPEARFSGVSRSVLRTLEEHIRLAGCVRATLASTRTARRFYLRAGYQAAGKPFDAGGKVAFPMTKKLRDAP